jgi:hypothetical protein
MAITLPAGLLTAYNEVCDLFIDNDFIGRSCTLIYPPKRTPCVNCIKPAGSSTTNVYKHGGPAPFTFGSCPLCGGSAFKEVEVTDTMRMRIYWEKSAWVKVGESTLIDSAEVMTIFHMEDVPKLRRAVEVLLAKDQTEAEYRVTLLGKPYPHGFGRSKFALAYFKGA